MVSLAIRTASSSSAAGMTDSTGPKISSWAMTEELSTLPNTVGSTYQPRSRSLRAAAAGGEGRAVGDALGDVALDPVPLPLGGQRPHLGLRAERVADPHLAERGRQRLEQLVVPGPWRPRSWSARSRPARTGSTRPGTGCGRPSRCPMSSRMTAADLPPSSRVQRAIRSPQMEAMRRPAAVEPVKVILSTRGSRTSSSETSRSAVTTLSTPAGRPTASAASASR